MLFFFFMTRLKSYSLILSYKSLKYNIQVWTYRLVYVLSTCKVYLCLLYTEPQNMLIVESNNKYISSFSKHFCMKNTYLREYHYENMPMQYTAIFHGCKNVNFQMKNYNIFLIFA